MPAAISSSSAKNDTNSTPSCRFCHQCSRFLLFGNRPDTAMTATCESTETMLLTFISVAGLMQRP